MDEIRTAETKAGPSRLRGIPWPLALLLALLPPAAAAVFGLRVSQGLGMPFLIAYALCGLLAAGFVRRDGLVLAMFAPPLVMIVAATIAVFVDTSPTPRGLGPIVLAIATPVVPRFPVMAATTAATLIIGLVRLLVARFRARRPEPDREPEPEPGTAPADTGTA